MQQSGTASSPSKKKSKLSLNKVKEKTVSSNLTSFFAKSEEPKASIVKSRQTTSPINNGKSHMGSSPSDDSGATNQEKGVPSVAALHNLGNTCFFNSVVQILRYTPGMVRQIDHLAAQIRHTEMLEEQSPTKTTEAEDGDMLSWKMVKNLADLFTKMSENEGRHSRGESKFIAIRPYELLDTLENLNPMFEGNQQHDCHELLGCLLCYIQEATRHLNSHRERHNKHNKKQNLVKLSHSLDIECLTKGGMEDDVLRNISKSEFRFNNLETSPEDLQRSNELSTMLANSSAQKAAANGMCFDNKELNPPNVKKEILFEDDNSAEMDSKHSPLTCKQEDCSETVNEEVDVSIIKEEFVDYKSTTPKIEKMDEKTEQDTVESVAVEGNVDAKKRKRHASDSGQRKSQRLRKVTKKKKLEMENTQHILELKEQKLKKKLSKNNESKVNNIMNYMKPCQPTVAKVGGEFKAAPVANDRTPEKTILASPASPLSPKQFYAKSSPMHHICSPRSGEGDFSPLNLNNSRLFNPEEKENLYAVSKTIYCENKKKCCRSRSLSLGSVNSLDNQLSELQSGSETQKKSKKRCSIDLAVLDRTSQQEKVCNRHSKTQPDISSMFQRKAVKRYGMTGTTLGNGEHSQPSPEKLSHSTDHARLSDDSVPANDLVAEVRTIQPKKQTARKSFGSISKINNQHGDLYHALSKGDDNAGEIDALEQGEKATVTLHRNCMVESYLPLQHTASQVLDDCVGELFLGKLGLRTRCLECETFTQREEQYQDVSVAVRRERQDDDEKDIDETCSDAAAEWVQSAINEVERLKGDNKYFCERCLCLVEAERSMHFLTTAPILTIHLKRFAATSGNFLGFTKINDKVPVGQSLPCIRGDCKNCEKEEHRFELYAVIVHSGISLSSGHYIAYVKTPRWEGNFRNQKCLRIEASRNQTTVKSIPPCEIQLKAVERSETVSPVNAPINSITLDAMADPNNNADSNNNLDTVITAHTEQDIQTEQTTTASEIREHSDWWYECDDEIVRVLSQDEFCHILSQPNLGSPYVLFYKACT